MSGYQTGSGALLPTHMSSAGGAGGSAEKTGKTHEVYDTAHAFPRMLRTDHKTSSASSSTRGRGKKVNNSNSVFSDGEEGEELAGFGSPPEDFGDGDDDLIYRNFTNYQAEQQSGPGSAQTTFEYVFSTSASASANPSLAPAVVPAADDARLGCAHCKQLFRPSENTGFDVCRRHLGRFSAPASASGYGRVGAKRRWTCCKAELETSEGCAMGKHVEDPRMTQILNTFNSGEREGYEEIRDGPTALRPGVQKQGGRRRDPAKAVADEDEDEAEAALKQMLEQKIAAEPLERNEQGDILHLLLRSDTLAGLSLKYGVPVSEIKQRNRVTSDRDLAMFKKVKIPQPKN